MRCDLTNALWDSLLTGRFVSYPHCQLSSNTNSSVASNCGKSAPTTTSHHGMTFTPITLDLRKRESSIDDSILMTLLHPATRLRVLTIRRHQRFWFPKCSNRNIRLWSMTVKRPMFRNTPGGTAANPPTPLLFRWTIDAPCNSTSFCYHFAWTHSGLGIPA